MKALILATDGFEDIEYFATRDILRRGGFDTVTANCRINYTIDTIYGREKGEINAFTPLKDIDPSDFDLLFVPGGGQVQELSRNPLVLKTIQRFAADSTKYLAAICAAPTLLGHLGLLQGKNYTCYPPMNADFGGFFHEAYAVADGHLITGDGPAAAIEFGLTILNTICGPETCRKVADGMFFIGTDRIINEK